MTMVPNLQVIHSFGSATNIQYRMQLQLPTIPLPMGWKMHSTRRSSSFSKSSSRQANETGIRSSVNVFRPIEQWSKSLRAIHFFL